jgi:predicted CoA-substrate-specific enzyme activase
LKRAGIDIGSRTIKLVIVENESIIFSRALENSFNPMKKCHDLLKQVEYNSIVATGYGRHLFANHYKCGTMSEIKAFARGAKAILPTCQTILDIGGQDTKVISLDDSGNILKFEMNDKCAAGTGRFLEIMAMSLGYSLPEFSAQACSAQIAEKINSMCTVFAESEVISLVAQGAAPAAVALGIHHSIAARAISMLQRIPVHDDLVFAGGVALNPCICKILSDKLQKNIIVPKDPQIIGALGSALFYEN